MKTKILISKGFEDYIIDYISFKGQSGKTQEAYYATCKELVRRFGNVNMCDLTFADIRDWKLWLDKGRRPNTVRNYLVCLRVVLKFLRQRNYNVLNPEEIPVPKRIYTEVEYLTETEMEEFIEEVFKKRRGYQTLSRYRNYAIVKTLYATGLRNAELCSLDVNSIKENTFTVIGKGNKPRIGFIDDDALEAINQYLALRTDNNPALFLTISGKRCRTGDIREMFCMIRNHSEKFKYIHPHTLRHSYATKLLKRRVDIRYIKEFMGHANMDTTARYTHIINDDLREIYLKAHQNA